MVIRRPSVVISARLPVGGPFGRPRVIRSHQWPSEVISARLPVGGPLGRPRLRRDDPLVRVAVAKVFEHRTPRLRGRQRSSEVVRGHQRSSEVIRGHQRSSEVIRGHQRSSDVIGCHQRSSAVIRGHQRSSDVISGHPPSARGRHLERRGERVGRSHEQRSLVVDDANELDEAVPRAHVRVVPHDRLQAGGRVSRRLGQGHAEAADLERACMRNRSIRRASSLSASSPRRRSGRRSGEGARVVAKAASGSRAHLPPLSSSG